jgi:catalase
MVQLAGDGDPISDGSLPWPEDRPKVELGMLTLSVHVPESDAAERALAFSPINLVAGIEPSDDPMISARAASYPISVTRRNR